MTGKKWTEEQHKKHRERMLGNKHNLGNKHTEETKKILSEKRKGKPAPEGSKLALIESNKRRKGQKRKPFTEEHKANLSKKNRERWGNPEQRKQASERTQKRLDNPETREQMSRATKQYWDSLTPDEKEKRVTKSQDGHKINFNIPSGLELKVAKIFDENGIKYEQQRRIGKYFADFYLPDINTVCEILGCRWHACEYCGCDGPMHGKEAWEVILKDEIRSQFITEQGYNMLFYWEHEIHDKKKFEHLIKKLKTTIESET